MNTEQEINALQNACNATKIEGLTVTQYYTNDKRISNHKYFLNVGGQTISPTLDYNTLNHFILGMNRAIEILKKTDIKMETTQKMRDNIEVYLFKDTKEADLQKGQLVCYQNLQGVYANIGTITDIVNNDGLKNYIIDTSMGAYLANELKLTKKN